MVGAELKAAVYQEISLSELYHICCHRLGDVQVVLDALRAWLVSHSDRLQ